jgi:hypothetical protein
MTTNSNPDMITLLSSELPSLWITATQREETPEKQAAWRRIDAAEHFVLHADATSLEGAAAQLVLARDLLFHINPEDAQDDAEQVEIINKDLKAAMRAMFSALCAIQKATGVDVRELIGPDYFTLEELAQLGCADAAEPEVVAA